MAKGAAMIGPKMATMLAFLLTDAPVKPKRLQEILSEAVETSFNCISVEGHTSTNDTVLLLANGSERAPFRKEAREQFAALVSNACSQLARMIPEDGEGASHLITISVEGCRDREEARTIARSVADDVLVKTSIHGADPNWGRIVSAAGYSGVRFDEADVSLWLNGVPLFREGAPVDFDAAAVSQSLRRERNVDIRLVFSLGDASIRFWTTDLTAEFVRLNADYTT
jgi:glutamate N-acetyltransferase/amino-acid N-acetyltransferase